MFNFFKKKEDKKTCACGCNEESNQATTCGCSGSDDDQAVIKILGGGCAKCNTLEENTRVAMQRLGLNLSVGHVKDFDKIATYGVMSTPALVVNEKVVATGRVISVEEAEEILKKEVK